MIKTIEIAPDILAKYLAEHIWNSFGTEDLNFPYNPPSLVIPDIDDLQTVIKEYLNR